MFTFNEYFNGIEVVSSYKVLWDRKTINHLYAFWPFKRSKVSLYLEWFIHSLCYRLGIQKDRAKDVFFEWDGSWFRYLFKQWKKL